MNPDAAFAAQVGMATLRDWSTRRNIGAKRTRIIRQLVSIYLNVAGRVRAGHARMNEPKKKIDHMVFNVRNLDEAVRFYTEVVGMKVVMRFDDRKMAFLSFGDRLGDIRLFETGATSDSDRQTGGFNHVAIEPDGGLPALEALNHRLIDKGAKIESLEEHACGRHKSIYFLD